MNRIYQGRVSLAQILDDKDNDITPPDWDFVSRLWEHHALFQDAVNYYLVCLLALANGATEKTDDLVQLRERITRPQGPDNPEGEHFYIWGKFRRRGVWRRGMGEAVAKYFTPGNAGPTFEECAAAALAGNPHATTEEGRKLLDRGLAQLLAKCTGDGGCQKSAKEYLPRYCDPKTKQTFGEDPSRRERDLEKERLRAIVHAPETTHLSPELAPFRVYSIGLPDPNQPEIKDAAAIRFLQEAINDWEKREPANTDDWQRLRNAVDVLPEALVLPAYRGSSAKMEDRFWVLAMYLFRHVEKSDFTFGLMRRSSRPPKMAKKTAVQAHANLASVASEISNAPAGDPIRIARGERGYVFRAFTSLPIWGGDASGELQWLNFDRSAFCEALKALHQIEAKGEEREGEWQKKERRHAFQRDPKAKWKAGSGGDDGERPPLLFGDPRIERLTQLVDEELKAEYEMSEGVEVKYGLHPRTIRGFRELRKKWNNALGPDEAYSDSGYTKVLGKLRDYQKENAQIMGSPALFEALLKQENWLIWREPDAALQSQWREAAGLPSDTEFSKDPLQALTDERELLADIERLKLPVRMTPADAEHSRRQFYFSDVTDLTKKGRLRHNQGWLEAEVAIQRNGKLAPERVRVHFTAPRLLRDQLTTTGEPATGWQQAMMEALGLRLPLTIDGQPARFEECAAVALMPEVTASGERRILLNFPMTLEAESIAAQLGKAARWDALQFGGADKESYWLRWPTTWIDTKKERKKAPPEPWWKTREPWRCLSVDLGQREAGAFALIETTPGDPPKPGISRRLGVADATAWWATVSAMGLLRLPGEDANVWRDGKWQQELSGKRGRNLVEGEWEEACDICTKLGFDPIRLLGTDAKRRSFPELNNDLLYALRRAQTTLARLQSWSSIAYEVTEEKKRAAFEKRRARIKEQIVEAIAALDDEDQGQELAERRSILRDLKPHAEKEAWGLVADCLKRDILKERDIIQRELVRIANRIQPLRGRGWQWVPRPDNARNFFLQQTDRGGDDRPKLLAGQRGLSIWRIEQLDSLRQRCQSLNRALQQTPGEPANLGRSKRGIELPDPCPELLDRLEKLKEQRVNQTAHLILAEALAVRLKAHVTDASERAKRDIHGEYERIPGREPVDFLVLENLNRYLASQGRSRGENSRLMKWCHRAILGKLKQLCEPYGLRVLETPAAHSSQFCSLTGIAGFRAVELTPDDEHEFRWKKHLDRLADPIRAAKLSRDERAESEQVRALFSQLEKLNADMLRNRPIRPKWRTLLAPVAGGPIFVAMRGNPMQADMNAAINIGLRAIAAPDIADIHVRIRSKRDGDKIVVRAENIREKARWGAMPPEIVVPNQKHRAELLAESHPNFFADTGNVAEFDQAEIAGANHFASGRALRGTINRTDWRRVAEINGARMEKWERIRDQADTIPM